MVQNIVITKNELNVLNVMTEKDINWNWMNLDRTLSIMQIPGFGNVVNIVNKLANEGLVIIEDSGHKSMPYYHVSEKGYNLVQRENKYVALITERNHSKLCFAKKTIRLFLLLKICFNLALMQNGFQYWKPLSYCNLQ